MQIVKLGAFLICVNLLLSETSAALVLPDSDIRNILSDRMKAISAEKDGIGLVVGVIEPQGRRIISHGHLGRGRPLDGNTVFEIGSVTKVFTGLLFADMVNRNEVAFSDPAVKYLPDGVSMPARNGRSISLLDLATHTSALPFMPELSAATKSSSAADYSEADLYQFMTSYKLTRDIGSNWEYSNLGYWLLSEALASRAGISYERLLRAHVITPLKLRNSDFVVTQQMKGNLSTGHDASLKPAPKMSMVPIYSLMPAAGGLFSTVNDLLNLLSVAMQYERSAIGAAVALSVDTRRPRLGPNEEQALGWNVVGKDGDQLIFMDGGTFGYSSCVAWDPVKRVGVAVLSNYAGSVTDIARHLLRPDFPLEHPKAIKHIEIKLDSAILDVYVGRYEAAGEGVFTVVREGDALMMEAPDNWGLPRLRIRPESATDFFASELPLRVKFQKDHLGRVSGILVYPPRGQKAVPARRVDHK